MDKNKKQFVFISGPYSGKTKKEEEANIKKALNMGRAVFQKGYYPIVPHLLVKEYYVPDDSGTFGYEALMQFTLAIVPKCDILLLYGNSPGADRERELAESLGKLIYFGVEDMPDLNLNQN